MSIGTEENNVKLRLNQE